MDTRVIIDVICPHCHSKLTMRKKVEVSSMNINCPGKDCGKKLHIVFDITKDPQRRRQCMVRTNTKRHTMFIMTWTMMTRKKLSPRNVIG